MSVVGIYITTAACPPVNSIIEVDVVIPPLFSVSKKEIKAKMKVLRIDPDLAGEGPSGFSAVGKGFALRAISEKTSDPDADSSEKHEGQK